VSPTPRIKVVWELKVFDPEGAKFAQELQVPLRLVEVVYLLSLVAIDGVSRAVKHDTRAHTPSCRQLARVNARMWDQLPVNCEPKRKYTPFFLYMAGASICSGKRCVVEVTLV
jgi:hypothetical protein